MTVAATVLKAKMSGRYLRNYWLTYKNSLNSGDHLRSILGNRITTNQQDQDTNLARRLRTRYRRPDRPLSCVEQTGHRCLLGAIRDLEYVALIHLDGENVRQTYQWHGLHAVQLRRDYSSTRRHRHPAPIKSR